MTNPLAIPRPRPPVLLSSRRPPLSLPSHLLPAPFRLQSIAIDGHRHPAILPQPMKGPCLTNSSPPAPLPPTPDPTNLSHAAIF